MVKDRPRTGEKGRRRAAYRRGRRAELVAALMLLMKGYRVLARRYRTPVGEIDLIVRRGRRLAFVEVKRRNARAEAVVALTPRQQARIRRAAEHWLAGRPADARIVIGFDVVLISQRHLPVHLVDALPHMPY